MVRMWWAGGYRIFAEGVVQQVNKKSQKVVII